MSARARSFGIAVCVLFVVACSPRRRLNVASAVGSRTFLVIVGEDDEPRSIHDLTDGDGLNPFELRDTDRLYGFRITTTDFLVGGTNGAIGAAQLAGATVGLWPDPTKDEHGCARCLAEVAVGPQPVYDGDSCPLATSIAFDVWTEDEGDGFLSTPIAVLPAESPDVRLAESLRTRVRVDWPGECACTPPPFDGPNPGAITFDLLVPAWSGGAFEALAIDPDNDTIGGFSTHLWFAADGADPSVTYERTDGPPGSVVGAVPITRTASVSRFFVATLSLDDRAAPAYHVARAEPSLPIETVTPAGLDDFFPTSIRRFTVGRRPMIAMSGADGDGPAVALCEDELSCNVLSMNACGSGAADDVAVTATGVVALFVGDTRLAVTSTSGDSGRCVFLDQELSGPPSFENHQLKTVQRLGAAGDRVYVCTRMAFTDLQSNFQRGSTFVASARMRADQGGDSWLISKHNDGNGEYCDDLLPIGSNRMAMGLGRNRFLVFGGDGELAEDLDWERTFGVNLIRARAASSRQLVMTYGRTPAGRTTFLGHGIGRAPITGGRAQVVQGGPFPTQTWERHVDFETLPDGTILAVPNGPLRNLQRIVNGTLDEVPVQDLYFQPGSRSVMVSATYDHLEGNLVVAGTVRATTEGDPNEPWWHRVDLDAGVRITAIDKTSGTQAAALDLTELVPGTIAYKDDSGRLYALRGNGLGVVDVLYDDPRTAETEEIRLPSIDGIVEGDGVAWAVGSGEFLARLVALPSTDPAGRFLAAEAVRVPALSADELTSGVSLCPDTLAVITGDVVTIVTPHSSELRVPSVVRDRGDLDLRAEHLLRAGDRLITITKGRWVLIDDHIVGRAPFNVETAHTDGTWLVVSGVADRIALARLP